MNLNLLEVDTLAAGVGASEQLHTAGVQPAQRVVGHERTAAQLLQRVPASSHLLAGLLLSSLVGWL